MMNVESESPLVSIASTSPQDWKYISEGAANIVFLYNGDTHHDPYFNGKVLRLRKSASTISPEIPAFPSVDRQDDSDEPSDPMIEFQHKIIQRLIPPEYLPRLAPIRVESSWLQELAKLCDSDRPSHRRQNDIDLTRKKAVLATDLVGSHALVVEIKPKWAFLPSPTHLSAATFPIKTMTCRFCMHTHYRSQNDHSILVSYCPLDLFSGDERRIDKALRDLWAGWIDSNGTMNNMRIFAHGQMLKPTEPSVDLPALCDMLIPTVHSLLVHTPVLRTLAILQRSLDVLDIEGLSNLWALSHIQPPSESQAISVPPIGSTSPDPTISEWTDFVDKYLSSHNTLDHAHPEASNLRYYLLAYLLSATFKDCSIMLRISPSDSKASRDTKTNSVTLIDLDPKSIDRLSRWERLDKEIVESYNGTEPKYCVDGQKGQ